MRKKKLGDTIVLNPEPPPRPLFEVRAVQHVSLTFPARDSYARYCGDFIQTLSADEARLLAAALASSADQIVEN